jgi:hypothetical protein
MIGISQFKICFNSFKSSTQTTSIHGIIEASKIFSFGIKILLNHFSFAQIVLGKTQFIFLNFQSSDNSQIKIASFINFSITSHSCKSIQTAIAKSKFGPDFLISAGAKFIVILEAGNLESLDFKAERSLSFDS